MATKVTFSSVDKIDEQKSSVASVAQIRVGDQKSYFQLDECVQHILQHGYSTIALQFPDELMSYSTFIATQIKLKTGAKAFVLADTSYGSCCIDEVAASHYNADLIIHFGQSCLANTGKIPVFYVFGNEEIKSEIFLVRMNEQFPEGNVKLLILFDVQYNKAMQQLKGILHEQFPNIVISKLNVENKTDDESFTTKFGRSYKLNGDIQDYKIIFVGSNERTLYNTIVSYNRNGIYTFNPKDQTLRKESMAVNKYLMRRFYLIEKAKDAQIVGVVLGTLGVSRYNEMVNRLKKVLKQSGKKYYTFVIGKINPAKLANFMEIDMFVLIACPENSLIDSKEFYKPIVTPYEMEIACLRKRSWTGDYVTDFRDLLPGSDFFVEAEEDFSDENEPEYSLVTGEMRTNNNTYDSLCTDMATQNESNSLVASSAKNASEYLASRTWQGLEISPQNNEVLLAVEGRSGIAMNYQNEK